MDRKVLLAIGLGCGVMAMIFVIIAIATSGLPSDIVNQYKRDASLDKQSQTIYAKMNSDYRGAIGKHKAEFATLAPGWEEQIKSCDAANAEADKEMAAAKAIIDADDADKIPELLKLLESAKKKRQQAVLGIKQPSGTAVQLSKLITERGPRIDSAKQKVKAMEAADLASLDSTVNQAIADWPEKKADLEKRRGFFNRAVTEASGKLQEIDTINKQSAADIDYPKLNKLCRDVEFMSDQFNAGMGSLPKKINELYEGWEVILTDMAIDEGSTVTFRQQLNKVVTKIPKGKDGDPSTSESKSWKSVDKSTYERDKKNLGMSLYRKLPGKYEEEQERVAQPPGYAYMASPEQGRNRYGYWRNDSSGSFWIWYGQYSMMRNIFWGSSYYPISRHHYHHYHNSSRYGRTYYGRDSSNRPIYGSDGARTKTKYASSRYVSSNGYKNTRYVQSGGKYKGTRYSSSNRSSSSGSRYGSSSNRSSSSGSRYGSSSSSRTSYSSGRGSSWGGSRSSGGK